MRQSALLRFGGCVRLKTNCLQGLHSVSWKDNPELICFNRLGSSHGLPGKWPQGPLLLNPSPNQPWHTAALWRKINEWNQAITLFSQKERKKKKSKGMPRWVCVPTPAQEGRCWSPRAKVPAWSRETRLSKHNAEETQAHTGGHRYSSWIHVTSYAHCARRCAAIKASDVSLSVEISKEGAVWDIYTACEGMWQDSPSPRSKRSPTLSFNGNAS